MLEALPKARMKMKICAIGEEAVGKTSLIHRYVADVFAAAYTRTLGTLISKKTIEVTNSEGDPIVIDAIIWDIMGQKGFMDLLRDAYLYNASGVFAVLDNTRKPTLEALQGWLEGVRNVVGSIPLIILANKADLKKQFEISKKEMATLAGAYDAPYYYTSAKTGENVGEAFEKLVQAAYERVISARVKSQGRS
jgi:small GTP-binding protein